MDNCSHNGEHLREAVLEMVHAWAERGYVDQGFVDYVSDEGRVAFPWTMIDKITPRPSEDVAAALTADGVEGMDVVVTSKQTYIAPFVNAEGPQYLVVEDSFPNGRPALERGGVLLCDRETVDKSEKMKVTVCLNPIHTALCTYDCMLGYDLFADGMADPQLRALAELIGKVEGMAVVPNPGILSPEAFLDECLDERFPNPYLGDTSLRIATDISQMVGIRFGITVRSHMERGDSAELLGIPLAIAGWLRCLLALDDEGKPMELAPEPMLDELQAALAGIELGKPESVGDKLRPILSNERIFYVDLYEAGLGQKIERLLAEELAGPGAVRATLVRYLG
jgi:fructuronate reductase